MSAVSPIMDNGYILGRNNSCDGTSAAERFDNSLRSREVLHASIDNSQYVNLQVLTKCEPDLWMDQTSGPNSPIAG